ncbi:MAG: hypothetical protein LC647_16610, partial [Beggiatoa sp.]|nr:hypothetical protein [Beggiatoa sp.]
RANREDRSPTWILSSEGPLIDHVEGFSERPEQQEMAEIVAETIEARGVLLCEAGTGTGKTFAYLVPSLLSGRKVIISTGTRALQDQLFYLICPGSSGRSRCPSTRRCSKAGGITYAATVSDGTPQTATGAVSRRN